jgi:putative nucleotidyltransferase with HDIG domain
MGKIYSIPLRQLVPGLILAEDLRHAQTGVVLIPSGTSIDERHLARLKHFKHTDARIKCMIPDPANPVDASSPEYFTEAGIKPLPSTVDETAKRIYRKAFETTKRFFNKYKNIEYADVQPMNAVAADISALIARDPIILSHVAILKAIDSYTFSHSVNVAIYATALAHFLGSTAGELREICLAGLLHDIGKLDIPRKLVEKPGPLTRSEYKIMQQHARFGYLRLKDIPYISKNVLAAVSQHHEKIDGTGYYQNLKGNEIHPWAIILAVADVYDALTTDRVYRMALLPHEGAEILMASCSLNHLEFNAVKVFTEKVPFYPPGARVVLNTGEMGHVVAYHINTPLRPIVNINRGGKSNTVDLALNHTVMITRIIR